MQDSLIGNELVHEFNKDRGKISEESLDSFPADYVIGKTKYIAVTGSVISGIGKGIFTASLGKLLQMHGLNVEIIKLEGYLNLDSGTLNPFRHGEVFVLEDGTEADMDLGNYERFLDKNFSKDNFLTSGRILQMIIEKERRGEYLGRDVQYTPHVTGEIKLMLRKLAMKKNADAVLIEIGGTVGDFENQHLLEAIRQLIYDESKSNVSLVNLTYIIEPSHLGEHKSKAAQLGIQALISKGIQPDAIVCRSHTPISKKIMEKISIYSNVPVENVFACPDVKNVYEIPKLLHDQKIDQVILDQLKLHKKKEKFSEQELAQWLDETVIQPEKIAGEITIGIGGKYTKLHDSYASILKALEHCSAKLKIKINLKWIDTQKIEEKELTPAEALQGIHALIVPGAFGSRGAEGMIQCIQFARENNLPYLGICFGFQMAVIEFARNVCGIKNANSTELDKNCDEDLIKILAEQDEVKGLGGTLRLGAFEVAVQKDSLAEKIFHSNSISRRFRHRYNVNPMYVERLQKNGMNFSGYSPDHKIMQILELPNHPYFIAGQFHPEFSSRPLAPEPMFLNLAKKAIELQEKKKLEIVS